MRFSRQLGQAVADLEVSAQPEVVCQRCMQPMRWPVKVKSRIALVSDYDAADRVPRGMEVFLVEADSVSVRDLVDEEIMLALPNVPRHAEGSECARREVQLPGQPDEPEDGAGHTGSETVCTVGRTVETQVVIARRGLVPWPFRKVAKRRRSAACIVRTTRLTKPALSVDPQSGETHLRHRITPDGFYRGKRVIEKPAEVETEE